MKKVPLNIICNNYGRDIKLFEHYKTFLELIYKNIITPCSLLHPCHIPTPADHWILNDP